MAAENDESPESCILHRPKLPSGVVAVIFARLKSRETVKRMLAGGVWLGIEQGLRVVLGVVVTTWVARHLGPSDFGLLSGALAVVAVAGAAASLGLNSILVRELTQHPRAAEEILGTAVCLRLLGSAIAWMVCAGIAWEMAGEEGAHAMLLPLAALALVAQSFDVVERWLQSDGAMRTLTLIRCAGMLASFALRAVLIMAKAPLEAFACAGVLEAVVAAMGWLWVARRGSGLVRWRFSSVRAREILRESLPLLCAALAIQVQAYGDQIMLAALSDSETLGQYAAALRLVSLFAFLPVIMQMVAAPEIARARRDDATLYKRRLHGLYRLAMGLTVCTAVPVALIGPDVLVWLFGDAYGAAGVLLPLLALRLFLTNMGVARGLFLANEGMARFAMFTAMAGAVMNVALNWILIPQFGATGAVIASLLSFTLTTFGLEWTDVRARANFRLMLAAVVRPWRSTADRDRGNFS